MTKTLATLARSSYGRRRLAARPLARTKPVEPEPMPDGAPDASALPRIGARITVELRAMQVRLTEAADRVLSTGDEAAVHDLRVAIRRTRTLLEIGREVFGRFHADEVRRALTELQRATGALRDEEVLLDLVSSLPLHTTDLSGWTEVRKRREKRLRSAVRRLIRTDGLARAQALLAALLAFRVKPSRDRRLVKFARRAVERAQREVERRRSGSGASERDRDRALHTLRVSYKRLRYTAETFTDVLPPELGQALARTAAGFQKRIGDVHDVDVVLARVHQARGLPPPTRQALAVALAHLRRERELAMTKELGWADRRPPSDAHLSGTDSLRKISIR
jgi:CHAD domain-containing protein